MNDLKGMNRNFNEDGTERDDQMLGINPSRPSRKGSLNRGSPTYDMSSQMDLDGRMQRSNSALDMERYQFETLQPDSKAEKKRGRSPFKFFRKSRDQSKDKHKSKSPTDRSRGRGVSGKYKSGTNRSKDHSLITVSSISSR